MFSQSVCMFCDRMLFALIVNSHYEKLSIKMQIANVACFVDPKQCSLSVSLYPRWSKQNHSTAARPCVVFVHTATGVCNICHNNNHCHERKTYYTVYVCVRVYLLLQVRLYLLLSCGWPLSRQWKRCCQNSGNQGFLRLFSGRSLR